MSRLLSTAYSRSIHDIAMLILRVGLGFIIVYGHGWEKIENFAKMSEHFVHFFGMSSEVSLSLSIFAEFVCGIFLTFGLLTRLAAAVLIINMLTALTMVHHWDIIQAQLPFLALLGFVTILLLGPGKISLDGAISKR